MESCSICFSSNDRDWKPVCTNWKGSPSCYIWTYKKFQIILWECTSPSSLSTNHSTLSFGLKIWTCYLNVFLVSFCDRQGNKFRHVARNSRKLCGQIISTLPATSQQLEKYSTAQLPLVRRLESMPRRVGQRTQHWTTPWNPIDMIEICCHFVRIFSSLDQGSWSHGRWGKALYTRYIKDIKGLCGAVCNWGNLSCGPQNPRNLQGWLSNGQLECAKTATAWREPLKASPVSRYPWQVVASGLFELNSAKYLLVADYL